MADVVKEIRELVESWDIRKRTLFEKLPYQSGSNAKSLTEFVAMNNAHSRRLMALFPGCEKPEFWESLKELAQNAERICQGGKVFVNGQDRTTEGM